MPDPTPGQMAYGAYVAVVERRPVAAAVTTAMWLRLMPQEQRAWEAAADAVRDLVRRELVEGFAQRRVADLEEDTSGACPHCGCTLELESCWACLGAGGFHNCGEDTCCCLDPEELDDVCEECDGEGEYLVCPNAMHHPRQDTP